MRLTFSKILRLNVLTNMEKFKIGDEVNYIFGWVSMAKTDATVVGITHFKNEILYDLDVGSRVIFRVPEERVVKVEKAKPLDLEKFFSKTS